MLRLTGEHMIATRVFAANAMDGRLLLEQLQGVRVNMVLTDVPYGRHSGWRETAGENPPPQGRLLDALLGILSPGSLAAVVADKRQKVAHEAYDRVDKFQIGKRQVVILRPITGKNAQNNGIPSGMSFLKPGLPRETVGCRCGIDPTTGQVKVI
jgi:hypothetical protein